MTKLSTIKVVAAAAGICASMFAAGTASAYSYATSHLKIENLRINAYTPTTPINAATVLGYSFSQNNTATLNGVTQNKSADCGTSSAACPTSSPILNALAANAPGSTVVRADNNFAQLGFDTTNSYSNADSVLYTAELPQGGVFPTSAELIAESLLNTNGSAQANALQKSTTSISTNFVVGDDPTGLSLSFEAMGNLLAQINGAAGSYLTQANMVVDFTLTKTGTNGTSYVTWSPDGDIAAGDCKVKFLSGVTCSELLDGASLNTQPSASVNPDTSAYSFGRSLFGIDIKGLGKGEYTLVLNAYVGTDVSRKVPEPDALALLGIALAGLAFVTKRKSAKQA